MSSNQSLLPTGKSHVSFSEVKSWLTCPWQHKLKYIDNLDDYEETIYTIFGTIVHDACENYLKTKTLDKANAIDRLTKSWEEKNYPNVDNWPEFKSAVPELQYWIDSLDCLDAVPSFLDETFPGWTCFEAEEDLMENIEDSNGIKFKGFIDGVLKITDQKGNDVYWIIDWKTAASYGWLQDKRRDELMQMQLRLYKHYWAQKHSIALKSIKCGFILLKKGSKSPCELITVSVGDKTRERAVKSVRSMISGLRKNFAPKNRYSCKFCPFNNTEHCKTNL